MTAGSADRSRSVLFPFTGVLLVLVIAVLVVVLVTRSPAPGTVVDGVAELGMEDYAFEPIALTIPVEEPVTLRLVNRDEVSHHVSFGRDLVGEDRRVLAFGEDLFAGLSPTVHPNTAIVDLDPPQDGFTVLVRGGETVDIDVTFPAETAGTWHIGCFTGRGCHYWAGLAAELTLE